MPENEMIDMVENTMDNNVNVAETGSSGVAPTVVGLIAGVSFAAGGVIIPLAAKGVKAVWTKFRTSRKAKDKDEENVVYEVDGQEVEIVKE